MWFIGGRWFTFAVFASCRVVICVVAASFPGAGMSIMQERAQREFGKAAKGPLKRFSVAYFQAGESFFQVSSALFSPDHFNSICWQLVCISCLFFLDFVPGFGSSSTIAEFADNFRSGFHCFFAARDAVAISSRCNGLCGAFGTMFVVCFATVYLIGTELTQYLSANVAALLGAVGPVLIMTFWFAFPSVNEWAGGTPYPLTSIDGLCSIISLPPILLGAYLFRMNEREKPAGLEGNNANAHNEHDVGVEARNRNGSGLPTSGDAFGSEDLPEYEPERIELCC